MPSPDSLWPEDSESDGPQSASTGETPADGTESASCIERTLSAWNLTHEDAQVALLLLNVLAVAYLIHLNTDE